MSCRSGEIATVAGLAKTGRAVDGDATFVTFGTPNFSQARARYVRSLARFGFADVRAFDPDSPAVAKARGENPEIFANSRGYGYWLWKPYIIEAAMAEAPAGARIFYTDIAVEMTGSPSRLYEVAAEHDVAAFRIGTGFRQRQFTKRDAFVLLDADKPEFWDDEMVNGGFLLLRNTPCARDFVAEWKARMRDPRVLTDLPGPQGLPELPEFRTHRHDQSVLSILATRHKLPILPDPSQWGRDRAGQAAMPAGSARVVATDFGQVFHHHRHRDRPLPYRLARWAKNAVVSRFWPTA